MRHSLLIAFTLSLTFVSARPLEASILIGTTSATATENITQINILIDNYNSDFGTSLPHVAIFVDKIEDGTGGRGEFINGQYSVSDFTFYAQDDGGAVDVNIFDQTPETFSLSDLGQVLGDNGFDSIDTNVQAFEQLSGPSVEYYVAKSGRSWSVWLAMDGINPFYADSSRNGYTRGPISDQQLAYDPVKNGVSHLSFYRSAGGGTGTIPEPASVAIWSVLASTCLITAARRRR